MKSFKSSYDKTERQKIVDYIVEYNLYFDLRGRSVWQEMERKNICPGRTWQSMKQHFITVIINSLGTLDLDDKERQRILKCFHRTYAKRELEKSDNDDELGGITKKSRLDNENETLITKEKHVTENQNETNKNTVEEVQNADQNNKKTCVLKEKYVTEDKIESDNRLEEIQIGNKLNEKKISNNEELNIDTSSKNIDRSDKNQIMDMVITSREVDVGSNNNDRIHEEQENNSSEEGQENNVAEEEQNESQISEMINEEREKEPDPPVEEFSEKEDVEIIHHIKENMDWSAIKFDDILYESCKNALINHSALSIKNRFLNVILPKLHKYDVLEISDVFLFYDRAGVEIPEEFMQMMKDSENNENCLSQDSNKTNNVINISDSNDSINLEVKEENTKNNNNNAINETFSDQTTIKNNKSSENICNNENKKKFSDFNIITVTKNEDEITGTEIDLILKPPKTIFYGEYIADQLCFNISNEKHVFILESIVDYDLIIKELIDKYSILKTNIHTVDAEKLKMLTKIKTLNEELDKKILKLARKDFKNKKITLPETALFKSLGVPSARELINSYNINNLLQLPIETYQNGNKEVDKNLNLNEINIDLNTCNINNDTFSINYSVSSHSSPIISMSKRRPVKVYENKNIEAINDKETKKINNETDIFDLSAELFSPVLNNSTNDNNPKLFELEADETREHDPPENFSYQQENVLPENDSEDEPLSQIKMKLIEEQSKEDEEIRHFSGRIGLLNVMKQNVLLSKKCKEIIEKKNAEP